MDRSSACSWLALLQLTLSSDFHFSLFSCLHCCSTADLSRNWIHSSNVKTMFNVSPPERVSRVTDEQIVTESIFHLTKSLHLKDRRRILSSEWRHLLFLSLFMHHSDRSLFLSCSLCFILLVVLLVVHSPLWPVTGDTVTHTKKKKEEEEWWWNCMSWSLERMIKVHTQLYFYPLPVLMHCYTVLTHFRRNWYFDSRNNRVSHLLQWRSPPIKQEKRKQKKKTSSPLTKLCLRVWMHVNLLLSLSLSIQSVPSLMLIKWCAAIVWECIS